MDEATSGSGMSIVGNIECNGPARVFGRIDGELRASDLLIGDGAQVDGNVLAQDVRVCGRKGTILPSASSSRRWCCRWRLFSSVVVDRRELSV
jgi:cytoskeletal protein CcmA (bactofilin family)